MTVFSLAHRRTLIFQIFIPYYWLKKRSVPGHFQVINNRLFGIGHLVKKKYFLTVISILGAGLLRGQIFSPISDMYNQNYSKNCCLRMPFINGLLPISIGLKQ
jgi:hypothetical protein